MPIGLDPGAHAVKAVKVARAGGKIRVLGAARIRVEPGEEDWSQRVRGPLGRLAIEAGLGSEGAFVGLSGRDLNLRFTQVPPVAPAKVHLMMQHEMVQIVGQSGGTVYTDYVRLDYPWKPGPIPMLVALAKNPFVEERMALLGAANVKVRDLCPGSLALFHAYAGTGAAQTGETVLLVDVGAANLELAVVRDDKLVFARNLAQGARAFTEAIAAHFQVPFAEAEQLKFSEGTLAPGGADKYRQVLSTPAGQLQSVISSTIGFAKTQTQLADLQVDRILLSGGGAGLRGFAEFLQKSIGKPVAVFDPFEHVDLSALPAEQAQALRTGGHDMTVALGLAVLGLQPRDRRLSLLPDSVKRRRHFLAHEVFVYLGAACLLAALIANMIVARGSRTVESAFRDRLKDESEVIEAKLAEFAETAKKRDSLAVKVDHVAREARPGVALLDVLAAARDALPEGVWLNRIRLVPRGEDGFPESKDGPILVLEGTIGEAEGGASKLMDTFVSQLQKSLREGRVKTKTLDKAPDSDRTVFQVLVI